MTTVSSHRRTATERALALAAFLFKLPKSKWNYERFVTDGRVTKTRICGTVCCAAGWLPKVDEKIWKWRPCDPESNCSSPIRLGNTITSNVQTSLRRYFNGLPAPKRRIASARDAIPEVFFSLSLSNSFPSV